MTAHTAETHIKDPLFLSALNHFQGGEWEAGLEQLDQLVDNYPLEAELRAMRQEMQLRARIDEDEIIDLAQERQSKLKSWAFRLVTVVVVVGLLYFGIQTYSTWLRNQWTGARQRLESEVQVVELAVKFRDAQDLMQAGRPVEAKALLEELAASNPDYPGLAAALTDATTMVEFDAKYEEAVRLINLEDTRGALVLLEEIADQQPYYKDVSLRINEIKNQSLLGDMVAQADKAYEAKDWATAAASYETVRALDPLFEPETIDERLFTSYINAAEAAVAEDPESLAAIDLAESYFRKALALRPQDPQIIYKREQVRETIRDRLYSNYILAAEATLSEKGDSLDALASAEAYFDKALDMRPDDPEVKLKKELARLYLQAQDQFNKGNWDDVILGLEYVYNEKPDYAMGTSRQTLYEAYIARGSDYMVVGDYEQALADFQRAALLAEEDPESKLRLYEAQINVAEAQGALGNYEGATLIFRNAIETADLNPEDLNGRPELVGQLDQAERYANTRSYRSAYRVYRDAARRVLFIFPRVTHVVQSGDYLTMLASRYHTTVDAIAEANDLDFSKKITVGQELVIPVRSVDN